MNDVNSIRLAGIAYESLVNGPGIRRVLFAQGCKHNCSSCFNKHTHSFDGGEEKKIHEIVEDILCNPLIRGVTFSGGDPLEQGEEFAILAKKIKKSKINIWCYTGYSFEYILENQKKRNGWQELLKHIDVIVDGKFMEEYADSHLRYRGSSNQRIIDVQNSLKIGKTVMLNYDN